MINLTFLGTSSAFPTQKRNHPGIYLKVDDKRLLLDCGEGTQRQIKIAGLSPKIDYILLTHWHVDHFIGIPGILESLAISNLPMPIIIGPNIKRNAKILIKAINLDQKIEIEDINVKRETKILELNNYEIFAFPLEHTVPCVGYKIKEKDRFKIKKDFLEKNKIESGPHLKPLLQGKDIIYKGRVIRAKDATELKKGKSIAYLTDFRFNKKIAKYIKDVDLLIIEATYSYNLEKKAKEYYHLTTNDAITLGKLANAKQIILTHISQMYENSQEYYDEVKQLAEKYNVNVKVAEDFLSLSI